MCKQQCISQYVSGIAETKLSTKQVIYRLLIMCFVLLDNEHKSTFIWSYQIRFVAFDWIRRIVKFCVLARNVNVGRSGERERERENELEK